MGAHALHDQLVRYRDGDSRAYARLDARVRPRIRRFIHSMTSDSSAVDDLVQLTMMKAHSARHRFEVCGNNPDRALMGWFFTIARNVTIDQRRRQRRRERHHARLEKERLDSDSDPIDLIPADSPCIDEALIRAEELQLRARRLRRALWRLPQSQRKVVELHKLQGLTMAEVATRLSLRVGTTRVRAHRAYRQLTAWLREP